MQTRMLVAFILPLLYTFFPTSQAAAFDTVKKRKSSKISSEISTGSSALVSVSKLKNSRKVCPTGGAGVSFSRNQSHDCIGDKIPEICQKASSPAKNDEEFEEIFDEIISDESLSWNFDEEPSWDISDWHFKPLMDKSLLNILSTEIPSAIAYFKGKYDFDREWPGSDSTGDVTKFSIDYQALALKIIVNPLRVDSLKTLAEGDLVDLSKPVLNIENGIYHSFLTIALVESYIEPEKVDIILRYKGIVNRPSSDGIVPILYAVRQKRFDLIRKFVDAGADINFTDGILLTPFMEAIYLQKNLFLDFFLSLGLHNPNVVVGDGITALALAATRLSVHKFVDIYVKLTTRGPIVIGHEAFFAALKGIYGKNYAAFNTLITNALHSQTTTRHLISAVLRFIYDAVVSNNVRLIHHLHCLKVPFKLASSRLSFLHIAARSGCIGVVQYFIKSKLFLIDSIEPEEDGLGLTALQLAHQNGHRQLVLELVKMGALVGLSQILQQAIESEDMEIIQNVVKYRSELNLFDLPNGFNLLTWSVAKDKPKFLEFFIRARILFLSRNDPIMNSCYTVPIPEGASAELKTILDYFSMSK